MNQNDGLWVMLKKGTSEHLSLGRPPVATSTFLVRLHIVHGAQYLWLFTVRLVYREKRVATKLCCLQLTLMPFSC